MDMYSYATFPRKPCLAFLDTTIHCMTVFVWLQIGGFSVVLQLIFFLFSAYSFFGGNARGQEMKGVAILRNELASGVFLKRNGYYLSP